MHNTQVDITTYSAYFSNAICKICNIWALHYSSYFTYYFAYWYIFNHARFHCRPLTRPPASARPTRPMIFYASVLHKRQHAGQNSWVLGQSGIHVLGLSGLAWTRYGSVVPLRAGSSGHENAAGPALAGRGQSGEFLVCPDVIEPTLFCKFASICRRQVHNFACISTFVKYAK
jgi:hypothetical protein